MLNLIAKNRLIDWLEEVLRAKGGRASLIEVCKYVWEHHEQELRDSGDLFYTWQYDIRWAATALRKKGIMVNKDVSPRGIWELSK